MPRRRRRDRTELPLETTVTATARARAGDAVALADLDADARRVVDLARRPVALVEVAAVLDVPASAVRDLVRGLVRDGYLTAHAPPPSFGSGGPGAHVLDRLLKGLRRSEG